VIHTFIGIRKFHTFEALRYKPEGRGFDSRWCYWNFYGHNLSGCAMVMGSTQALTENEYQEYFLEE